MKKILLLSLFTFTTLAGHADEGMWMLTDLKEQNAATMYDMGLDISIDKVYCPDSISRCGKQIGLFLPESLFRSHHPRGTGLECAG